MKQGHKGDTEGRKQGEKGTRMKQGGRKEGNKDGWKETKARGGTEGRKQGGRHRNKGTRIEEVKQ